MRNLELRHLRYFVAVAESGSLLAAARSVGIVQPALSRQIRQLEEGVGTALFVRSSSGMALTAAGEGFLCDAKKLLADLQRSQERALRAARGEEGELRLGVLPNYLSLPIFAEALSAFRRACPAVNISVLPMLSAQQAVAIDRKEIDAGVMAWRSHEAAHLGSVLLLRERFVLAVPAEIARALPGHPQLADVGACSFVWFDPIRSVAQHHFLMVQCSKAGFVPEVGQMGSDIPTMIGLVAAGMGCAFVPASLASACPATVTLVELDEVAEVFDVDLAYDARHVAPVLRQFLTVLGRTVA